MIRALYRALWAIAAPAVALLRKESKLARAVRGRLAGAAAMEAWARAGRGNGQLVWIHAASVGEGKQAEAALLRLRTLRPDWQVVYTYSSPSAIRFAAGLQVDYTGYLPADRSSDIRKALAAVRPSAVVFSATDIWPELAQVAAEEGVPTGIISATLTPASSRSGALAKVLLGPAYVSLAAVGAVGTEDAERLKAMGVAGSRISITGDTRHDSAAARASAIDRGAPYLVALAGEGPILLAGSTWPADEAVLLQALRDPGLSACRIVLAPHEPTSAHLAQLESRLRSVFPGAPSQRLSELEAAPAGARPPWRICIVDRVGLLADLYSVAEVAFVGGGFHGSGLHSVIEPAALGVPVLFGPRWQNSRDARLLLNAHAAHSVSGPAQLAAALHNWLKDDSAREEAGRAARGVVESGLGAAERSAQLIVRVVEEGKEGNEGKEGKEG